MAQTKIEWADRVWNPVTGCTKISPGCQNCYAERMAKRLAGRCGYPAEEPFRVTLHLERLVEPLRWMKPSRIFVCSMGDLFHENVPDAWIARVWAVMQLAVQHTFLVLTKRPARLLDLFPDLQGLLKQAAPCTYGPWPLPNVWIGVTAENQEMADKRIPILLQIPAAVRFVSCEPLLGPIKIPEYYFSPTQMCDCNVSIKELGEPAFEKSFEHTRCPECGRQYTKVTGVNWIIVGGETGHGARPMHPDWVRNLRDQCQAASVPFFFKQWGEWAPVQDTLQIGEMATRTRTMGPRDDLVMWRCGKKKAGRLLDGLVWNEYPTAGRRAR